MKNIKFLFIGVFFGIVLSKSQAVSWYRIYEMFKFQSFHMYGIIGTAVILSMLIMQLFKKGIIKDFKGNLVSPKPKKKGTVRPILGGISFGLGWAISGACAAPLFILLGFSFVPTLVIIVGALLGAFVHGLVRNKLPQN